MLERAGRTLLSRLGCRAVLITRGSRGMALFEPDRPTDHIPIVGSDQIADVTGAGDTVIATFALAAASGASFAEAARLANHAGGLVVMKRGTATVSRDELAASAVRVGSASSWDRSSPTPNCPRSVARDRAAGRTIAFANGCFDILHVGHVRYLAGAAREGDRLIVAINDDASVRALKGSGPARHGCRGARRTRGGAARRGLRRAVRRAVGRTPAERQLKPDVHCKGTDYTVDTVPERETVRAYGGRIAIVGDPKDHSTKELLARLGLAPGVELRTSKFELVGLGTADAGLQRLSRY